MNLISLTGGFVLGWIATWCSIKLAHRFNIRDLPVKRSSHTIPTPRIGGLGIAGPFILFHILFLLQGQVAGISIPDRYLVPVLVGGIACFIFGLSDDLCEMKAILKLLFQCVCAMLPVAMGFRIHSLARFTGLVLPPLPGSLLAFCWILLMINAFNFMDGMNGKAATFAMVAALFLSRLAAGSLAFVPPMLAFLAGSCIGFLVFNLTPARTFMGDSGSQFLGYFLGVLPLYLHSHDPERYPFGSFVILLFPFLYDALYTLIRRIRRGENLFEAHRSHLYQRLLIAGWTHSGVLRLVFVTYLICGISSLVFAVTHETKIRIVMCLLTILVMGAYTIFVWSEEKKNIRTGSP